MRRQEANLLDQLTCLDARHQVRRGGIYTEERLIQLVECCQTDREEFTKNDPLRQAWCDAKSDFPGDHVERAGDLFVVA